MLNDSVIGFQTSPRIASSCQSSAAPQPLSLSRCLSATSASATDATLAPPGVWLSSHWFDFHATVASWQVLNRRACNVSVCGQDILGLMCSHKCRITKHTDIHTYRHRDTQTYIQDTETHRQRQTDAHRQIHAGRGMERHKKTWKQQNRDYLQILTDTKELNRQTHIQIFIEKHRKTLGNNFRGT